MASLLRLLQIVYVVAQHGLAQYAPWLARRIPWSGNRLRLAELTKPERLKAVLESLGGSFVKLGQMLALQPDILPFEYCYALYGLLDRVHPVAVEEIEEVFRMEIGRSPSDVFDEFDRKPIASGSIGQVHVGWLNGSKVAVKIQRPDTQAGFHRDVKLMKSLVWFIKRLHITPLAWMIDPLTEFADWTVEELDFRSEARYMKQLRRNAAENSRERIPAMYPEYSTERVLVVDFLEGVTLLDHIRNQDDPRHQQRLAREGFDCDQFSRAIIDNFLGDAFRHGMFHADLHPANLIILPNNVVGYIDFGITGVISQFSRQNLVTMTLAYARRDLDGLCARFFDVSSMDERSDPAAFRAGIKRLADKWYKGGEDDPSLQITTTMVMLDMLLLSRQTGIWPQRDVIKYIRSAIAIDGLIRQFAPHFDVGDYLAVACRRYLSWHARKSLLSHDALINWSKASAELMRSGAFRFSTFLERVGDASTQRSSIHPRRRRRQLEVRYAAIGLVACTVGVLAFTTNESFELGLNLFTSQLIVATAFGFTLWRCLWSPSLQHA
ncbi:MAG TPA: AarF/UbiB family protein [Pirellulaceae bacterium]|nr:AarF/UbiB family protein [Pirellulaceae bacterium]